MIVLLDNVSIDTVGSAQNADGGNKQIIVTADDFGSGAVSVEVSQDKVHWAPATKGAVPVAYTSNATDFVRKVGQATWVRASLAGSSSASNVKVIMAD